jgi:acyl-CoA synthetase (NDP forming)
MEALFNIGAGLMGQPLPGGRRVVILTGGGGWGVLAADACAKAGLDVIALPQDVIAQLDRFLPPWWSRGNPVDLVAGLSVEALLQSLECLLACDRVDGVVLLGINPTPPRPLPPSAGTEAIADRVMTMLGVMDRVSDQIVALATRFRKPVVSSTEIPSTVGDVEKRMAQMLGEKGIVVHPWPNDAATVMGRLADYAAYLRGRD